MFSHCSPPLLPFLSPSDDSNHMMGIVSLGPEVGGRGPPLMDAGTLGDESNESHIWNSNQDAQQDRGSNTRRAARVPVNLTS